MRRYDTRTLAIFFSFSLSSENHLRFCVLSTHALANGKLFLSGVSARVAVAMWQTQRVFRSLWIFLDLLLYGIHACWLVPFLNGRSWICAPGEAEIANEMKKLVTTLSELVSAIWNGILFIVLLLLWFVFRCWISSCVVLFVFFFFLVFLLSCLLCVCVVCACTPWTSCKK